MAISFLRESAYLPPQPQRQPQPVYPAVMGSREMEGYVLQSLEIISTTPTSQYYGPESAYTEPEAWKRDANRRLEVATSPRPLTTAAPTPQYDPWEAEYSFRQVHLRTIEGQPQPQQQQERPPSYTVSPTTTSPASSMPVYSTINPYHNNIMPQYPSSAESGESQNKVEEPRLKRMRNTAASARFRAKKKQHEQMLEQAARENQATLDRLESRVAELETENRWLKNLVMDKSEATLRKELKGTAEEREGCEHTDGVGTKDQ